MQNENNAPLVIMDRLLAQLEAMEETAHRMEIEAGNMGASLEAWMEAVCKS